MKPKTSSSNVRLFPNSAPVFCTLCNKRIEDENYILLKVEFEDAPVEELEAFEYPYHSDCYGKCKLGKTRFGGEFI